MLSTIFVTETVIENRSKGMTLGEGFFLRGKTFFEIHNYHPD